MPEEQQTENPSEENLFDRMANLPPDRQFKKLQRSNSNIVLTGVCSGIADYLKMDAANIRLIALLSILMGGWSVVAYLITALLLPVEKKPVELTDKERSALQKENFKTVLSGLFILVGLHFALIYIGIGSSERLFILPNGFAFPIVAVVTGVLILTRKTGAFARSEISYPDKYFRSRTDRKIMGVCAGLGKYLNIDAAAMRIIFTLATLLTFGMFVILYLLLSVFSHLEPEQTFE